MPASRPLVSYNDLPGQTGGASRTGSRPARGRELEEDQDEPEGGDGASTDAERGAAARPRQTSGEGTSRDADGYQNKAMIDTRQPVQETRVERSMAWMGGGRDGEGRKRGEGRRQANELAN